MKTHSELINCVRRELSMRIAVYPRRVADGKMPQEKADHEIESMRQVLEILEKHNPQKELTLK